MRFSQEVMVGVAGENLVCFDLIMKGVLANRTDQGMEYDIIADNAERFLKVQVKSNWGLRKNGYYAFVLTCGKNSDRLYSVTDYDVLAFAALDKKLVGYIKSSDLVGKRAITIVDDIGKQRNDVFSLYSKDDITFDKSKILFSSIVRDPDWFSREF